MVAFFIAAVLMVLVALGLVLPPLFREREAIGDNRDRQNADIARERIRELTQQRKDDLIGDDELTQARMEVEQALLDEIGDEQPASGTISRGGPLTAIVIGVSLPVLAGVMYLLLGQPQAIEFDVIAARESQSPHQAGDATQVIAQLKTRLRENPADIEGWYLLGNSYMSLQQYDTAAEIFQKLREIAGDDPELLIRQADALAMANGNRLSGKPEALIQQALQQQPDHPTALWLAGIAAQQSGQPGTALQYWERAKSQLAENPQAAAELESMIAQVRQQLGAGSDVAGTDAQTPAVSITVNVSLDPALVQKASLDDALFILARAANGPPMPLAVVRRQVKDLPLETVLDDSLAMMPAMKLSQFNQVRVVAKISKSGDAITKTGDLIGESAIITPGGDSQITIKIDTVAK